MSQKPHHFPHAPLEPNHHKEPHNSEEEKIEVDERWLVTYADKMTLLSGCFLMLFALSTLDPERMNRFKEQAQKSFGKQAATTASETSASPNLNLELKNKELEKTVTNLQDRIKALDTEIQAKSDAQKLAEKSFAELQNQLNILSSAQKSGKTKELAKENSTLKSQLENLKTLNQSQAQALEESKLKINALNDGNARPSFLAMVMSWGTRDHDIDLIVKDPQGKVFNFKTRNYDKHPGLLVLDTRQGPGVEIWQSDRIIPGIYTFTYQFYSSYGNNAPCPITGSVFTPLGKLSLPMIELNQNQKQHIFRIEMSPEGKSKILK